MTAAYDALSRYRLADSGQQAFRTDLPNKSRTYTVYTTKQGDTMESIATRYLGSPLRFWEIADANPQVKFPLDLGVGTLLRLPA